MMFRQVKIFFLNILCLFLLFSLYTCQSSPGDYHPVESPSFEINLDLPPFDRWNSFPESYCQKLNDFEAIFVDIFISKVFKTETEYKRVEQLVLDYSSDSINQEYFEELSGLAAHCKASIRYLAMYNLMYEFGQLGGCTAVAYKVNGKAYMSKNLDYSFHDLFSDILFTSKYYSQGKLVFEGRQLFGFLGSVTYLKNGVSATLNERHWNGKSKLLKALETRTLKMNLWEPRQIVMRSEDYDAVSAAFREVKHMTPAYYTISDERSGRAEVVTLGFDQATESEEMTDWFIVQANSDRKVTSAVRRAAAEKKMAALPRDTDATHQGVFDNIMSQDPNFSISKDSTGKVTGRTISTSYFDPQSQRYKLVVWKLTTPASAY